MMENQKMDQSTARKLAAQVGGIATQQSRYHGRFARPGEPWIVLVGGFVLTEAPA
jgi:hypothetical protein